MRSIENKEKVFFLRYVKMSSSLDTGRLKNLADRLILRKFSSGSVIISEGEMNDSIYFLKKGTVLVYRTAILPSGEKKILKVESEKKKA